MEEQQRKIVELLVVLFVIGVIGALCAVAVNAARARSRDAVRISNVRQVQSALENAFNAGNAYPAGEGIALGSGAAACLGEDGFAAACQGRTFLRVVPATDGKGLDGLSFCAGVADAACYLSLREESTYRIQFELERDWREAGLAKGLNCASPEGVTAGACRL